VEAMDSQQINYQPNGAFVAVDPQHFVDVLQVKIPFCVGQQLVNMRLELLYLLPVFHGGFKNEDHFCN